ncbi:MAG: heavy-metal-associated domain-containing protein [Bacteroidales bacterium]|nr:heavy-metal-associated domain-containing protein [Bacteroidales bacterium]
MKNILFILLTAVLFMGGGKDLRQVVVTPTPQMHCASCENKIKNNLRFEKGIEMVETSIEKQTVTITYNAKKTTADKVAQSFTKFGYTAQIVSDKPMAKKKASGKRR